MCVWYIIYTYICVWTECVWVWYIKNISFCVCIYMYTTRECMCVCSKCVTVCVTGREGSGRGLPSFGFSLSLFFVILSFSLSLSLSLCKLSGAHSRVGVCVYTWSVCVAAWFTRRKYVSFGRGMEDKRPTSDQVAWWPCMAATWHYVGPRLDFRACIPKCVRTPRSTCMTVKIHVRTTVIGSDFCLPFKIGIDSGILWWIR